MHDHRDPQSTPRKSIRTTRFAVVSRLGLLAVPALLAMAGGPAVAQWGGGPDTREACRRAAGVLVNQEARWDDSYRDSRAQGSSLRWRASDGTYGFCRADSRGRVYQVQVERWGAGSDIDVWPGSGVGESSRTLRCESDNGRLRRCPIPRGAAVRLVDRLSDSPCVLGRSWSYDRDEIRVDDGCRAVFEVRW